MPLHPSRRRPAVVALALAATTLAGVAAEANHRDAARDLAATCANCHGTDGKARGAMRPLAGMPAPALVTLIDGFKSGRREATVMHQIARGYSDEQIRLIADHFAAQERPR